MTPSRFLSIRWWLPLAFAVIAAVTAIAVAQVFRTQSQTALHDRAQDLAAGSAVGAAARISDSTTLGEARRAAAEQARRRRVALFLLDDRGRLLSASTSQGVAWTSVTDTRELLQHALSGRRFLQSSEDSPRITVALPLRAGPASVLVGVASRPDLVAAASIVRDRIWVAAAWATVVGALTGLLLSPLITRRIRRIGVAAAAIADGEFDEPLTPRFPDELGRLAQAVDTMRRRLRTSFGQLAGERDQLRSLIEQLHEGVIGVADDFTVVVANARASALLGQEVREGEPLCDPWPATDLRAFTRELFAPGMEPRTIRVVPAADQTYAVTGVPASAAGTAVLVVADVTEQERRERAEREFVANAAHELRTPLTAIASAVEVLQQGAKEDRLERDRFLTLIERQTRRLERLGRALLTLARAQTRAELVELTPLDVALILREVAEDMDLDESELELHAGVRAMAHADLLRQAIENLVGNARRYAAGERLLVSAWPEGDAVVVEVRDHGPGMSPADAERAVERFFRSGSRDAAGFGLGLSIAREVARAVGGRLEIETRIGGGTAARMILHRASPADSAQDAEGTEVGRPGRRVVARGAAP